jgi:hypothetical protein
MRLGLSLIFWIRSPDQRVRMVGQFRDIEWRSSFVLAHILLLALQDGDSILIMTSQSVLWPDSDLQLAGVREIWTMHIYKLHNS